MKIVVQRVKEANVKVDGKIVGACNAGYMLLVGFTHSDDINIVKKLAKKVITLRVFSDSEDKMNKSIKDINGSILSISQFTLYANSKTGNRPSFTDAMPGLKAKELYDLFNQELRSYDVKVEEGIFGAMMDVSLINDGPVTIILGETN